MEETKKNGFHDYSFSEPANYHIKIQGRVVESWWDRLGDMEIQIHENPGGETYSVLTGRLNDQAALSGILNSLYELHHVVLEVQIVKDNKEE
ncbi:hypothetical protein [Eudoraea sp.]|nr:hypothetical protein [uncultured Eudoraea sp.]